MLGYVYVVTTNRYQRKSIVKIGFTTNLTHRLKLFNATRIDNDLFYCVRRWRTVHYSRLEAFLHMRLNDYRVKNEFFKVPLSLIEEHVEEFATTNGPQFFYDDVVLVNKDLFKVQWIPSKQIFIYNDELNHNGLNHSRGKSRIKYVDEISMREVVVEWLACVDVYGLLRFVCQDVIRRLVELLKESPTSPKRRSNKDKDVFDLSAHFRLLKL